MKRFILVALSVILSDFYFFPIEFIFLLGINTKMVMAVVGLILLGISLANGHKGSIDKGFFWLSSFAIVVSAISFASIVINNTFDYSYTSYIVSMWVWLGGAYTMIRVIRATHGSVSVSVVCNYLIAVCVMQCIIAYILSQNALLDDTIGSIIGGESFMSRAEGRMHGIGAALDVAGLRFSAVLVMTAYMSLKTERYFALYIIAFIIIGMIGSMIGRTTIVGIILSIVYWLYAGYKVKWGINRKKFFVAVSIMILFIVVSYVMYNINYSFRNYMRFGFEGFFSLAETGKWNVSSNDILVNMIKFPNTLHTWLIGDGYCANPLDPIYKDPYYIGPIFHGYYMATDIGYLRFIFYFGIFGMLAFVAFFMLCGKLCMVRFADYKVLFLLLVLVNFIGWCKVATDIFLVFAPFLCISKGEGEEVYPAQSTSKDL